MNVVISVLYMLNVQYRYQLCPWYSDTTLVHCHVFFEPELRSAGCGVFIILSGPPSASLSILICQARLKHSSLGYTLATHFTQCHLKTLEMKTEAKSFATVIPDGRGITIYHVLFIF